MIVKILQKSKTFKAVRYNTDKIEKNKGELVKVSGFDALQGLSEIRPEDYINYLTAIASRNKHILYPQFHAAISVKGKTVDKNELIRIAEKWLHGMGYGKQPYLLIFHIDTQNNHLHIVSSRVDREGRKISDSYEKIRAYKELNRLIGKDEAKEASLEISNALRFQFSTRAQFTMLLETQGYASSVIDGKCEISKFGKKVAEVNLSKVDAVISSRYMHEARIKQLSEIFEKYRQRKDANVFHLREKLAGGVAGKIVGYSSPLCEHLSSSFGLRFIFHFKNDLPPYGYTIIDYAQKHVFKGSEIMALAQLIENTDDRTSFGQVEEPKIQEHNTGDELVQNITQHHLRHEFDDGISATDLSFDINISDDVDDEQILGRNRRKQRKARTNTR